MKTTLTAIMITVFFLTPALCFSAYRIHLKDGREFVTDRYWLEGGQIKFKRFGGVIGIQKELVREIEEVEDIPEQGAPTKREKAGEAKKTEVAEGAETGDQENIGEKGAGTSKPGTASGDAPPKDSLTKKAGNDLIDIDYYKKEKQRLEKELSEAKYRYLTGLERNDKEAKYVAARDASKIKAQIEQLKKELKEKNNGVLPEWWNQ